MTVIARLALAAAAAVSASAEPAQQRNILTNVTNLENASLRVTQGNGSPVIT